LGEKVAYIGPQQIDSINDSVPFSITNISRDITVDKIKNIYDYVLIKGHPEGYKSVRKIVRKISISEDPLYTFPNLVYFGEGSTLYKIK